MATLTLRNKMNIKMTIFVLAMMTATSVAAGDEAAAIGDFFNKATLYAKKRDYSAFQTLYCGKAPESLGKTEYFENKEKIFSNLTLAPKQQGLFDNLQYDFILYLCSHTKGAKVICMVQPVIKQDNRLCILNVLNPQ
ncbi:MAG: hypothetical protein GC149_10360 [Gammaproteobacteria bacterium]|nr:hypothetical protein [Gammaproteobacteria bacterium]